MTLIFFGNIASLPLPQEFDFTKYLSVVESKHLCDREATTTEPAAAATDLTTSNTQADESTINGDMNQQATTQSSGSSSSTETSDRSMHITTSQQDSASVITTPSGPLPCKEAGIPLSNANLTRKEVEEALKKIISHLSVEAESLSKVKRSKISAPDERTSSTMMGIGGLVFILVVLGLMLVFDIPKLVQDVRLASRALNR